MEKIKQRPLHGTEGTFFYLDRLRQQMSELTSLREQVAQAELAAHRYGSLSERAEISEGAEGEKPDQ